MGDLRSPYISVSENIRHKRPIADEVASAEACENHAIASVLRVPVPPFFEQGRPERQPPNLVAVIDRDVAAAFTPLGRD
jgi:hypothetical protein